VFRERREESSESSSEGAGNSRGGAAGAYNKKKKRPKKKTMFRKKRPPLTLRFDYKEIDRLLPFLTEEGKIVAARVSGLRAFQQRELTTAVKRARQVAFLSATAKDFIY